MFLQHKTWAACRGGAGPVYGHSPAPDSNSRADGSPARGARTGSIQPLVQRLIRPEEPGPCLPALRPGPLSRNSPSLRPWTPTHCHPFQAFLLKAPWPPLHPCLGAEYSFLSIPCPQNGAEAHPLQHCEVCIPTPDGETEAQYHRCGKEQVQAETRHVACVELHA